MLNKRFLKFAFLGYTLLLVSILSGCAATTIHLPDGFTTGTKKIGKDRKIIVKPFIDKRVDPYHCGIKKTTLFTSGTKIKCAQEPTEWLTQALTRELKNAGFNVLQESDDPDNVMIIEGKLVQLFVKPKIGVMIDAQTSIIISLNFKTKSGPLTQKTIQLKSSRDTLSLWMVDYQGSMGDGIKNALTQMVFEIISIMNAYPELD